MENKRVSTVIDMHEQLLPGLPDEITLNCICTKLPWRAICVLPTVSSRWQRVIRSRQVYEVRVRFQSTETLVILGRMDRDSVLGFDVYSARDKACYSLPWTPLLDGLQDWSCKCVSMDGKMYVVGRVTDHDSRGVAVCVLDMLGQGEWKKCADMQVAREKDFGCAVLDKKIYVIGGSHRKNRDSGSEVYDPDTDVWSSISPLKSFRCGHSPAAVGEELYVYDGDWCRSRWPRPLDAVPREIYNPVKDEWREGEPWSQLDPVFMYKGKFYAYRADGIYVHDDDLEKNSWKVLQSFDLLYFIPDPRQFVAVGDEILAFHREEFCSYGSCFRLRQTKGFASAIKGFASTTKCSASTTEGFASPTNGFEWETVQFPPRRECEYVRSQYSSAEYKYSLRLMGTIEL